MPANTGTFAQALAGHFTTATVQADALDLRRNRSGRAFFQCRRLPTIGLAADSSGRTRATRAPRSVAARRNRKASSQSSGPHISPKFFPRRSDCPCPASIRLCSAACVGPAAIRHRPTRGPRGPRRGVKTEAEAAWLQRGCDRKAEARPRRSALTPNQVPASRPSTFSIRLPTVYTVRPSDFRRCHSVGLRCLEWSARKRRGSHGALDMLKHCKPARSLPCLPLRWKYSTRSAQRRQRRRSAGQPRHRGYIEAAGRQARAATLLPRPRRRRHRPGRRTLRRNLMS